MDPRMTPYYEQDGITIYHGDCREILPTLDLVNLVLTDPPYGMARTNHGRSKSNYVVKNDHSQEAGIEALALIPESAGIIVFAHPKRPWPGEWRQHLVWDKGPAVGGGGDIKTCWKFTWELIQVARTGRLNGKRESAVLRHWVGPMDCSDHPSQKPISLIRYLIEKASDPGDLVLDPFLGSGTTLLAAKELGRRAIGIELEERYCEIAARRLQQSVLPLIEVA